MRLESVYTQHHPHFGEGRFYAEHGYIHYGVDSRRKRVFIHNVEVEKAHRGQGLGLGLVQAVAAAYPAYEMDLGYTTDAGEALWRAFKRSQDSQPRTAANGVVDPRNHGEVEAHNARQTQLHGLYQPQPDTPSYSLSDEDRKATGERHGVALDQFHAHIRRIAGLPPRSPDKEPESDYGLSRTHWRPAVAKAMSNGHLSIAQAEARGYHGDQREHGSDGMGNSPRGDEERYGGYQKYPQPTMYHTTNNVADILKDGGRLKSRADQAVEHRGSTGLGGGGDDTISLTSDKDMAHDIYHGLHEHHAFVTGKIKTMDDLFKHHLGGADPEKTRDIMQGGTSPDAIDQMHRGMTSSSHEDMHDQDHTDEQRKRKDSPGYFKTQEDVDRDFDGGWRPKPGAEPTVMENGKHLYSDRQWERPSTESENHQQRSDAYRSFSYARDAAGGHRDPYFVSTNAHAFAQTKPENFAVLHVKPYEGAQGFPQRANQQHHKGADSGEWRTHSGDALGVQSAHSPVPRHEIEQSNAELAKDPAYANYDDYDPHHHTEAILRAQAATDVHPDQGRLFEDDHSGHLPNPIEGGHDWHHGTPKEFDSIRKGRGDDDDEDQDEYEPDYHTHWNSYLGDHWTSMRGVANTFAKGDYHHRNDSDKGEGHIWSANLGIKNPKMYGSESHMDSEAVNHAWGKHQPHDPSDVHAEFCNGEDKDGQPCYGMEDHEEGDAVDKGVKGHYTQGHAAANWLTTHPDKEEIAYHFKRKLQDEGHDGIVYGNDVEGPDKHPCAITFNKNQVHDPRRSGVGHEQDHGNIFARPHKPVEWIGEIHDRMGQSHDPNQRQHVAFKNDFCKCCHGTGEHDSGRECYRCDGGLGVPEAEVSHKPSPCGGVVSEQSGRKDWAVVGAVGVSAYRPTEKIFGPTKEDLDPRLFEGDHMRDYVRMVIMGMLDGHFAALGFADWKDWTRVYLAGSESTFWWGNRDFDTLLGLNYGALMRAHPEFHEKNLQQISDFFNKGFRESMNSEEWRAPWDPEPEDWHITFFINPMSWDIADIKPYGAYSISDDKWVVRPPHLPQHSAEDFDKSVWPLAESYADRIRHIIAMPHGGRRRGQAHALLEFLHSDRGRAFSPRGHGWNDIGNVVWKYLDVHPEHLLEQLIAASKHDVAV